MNLYEPWKPFWSFRFPGKCEYISSFYRK